MVYLGQMQVSLKRSEYGKHEQQYVTQSGMSSPQMNLQSATFLGA